MALQGLTSPGTCALGNPWGTAGVAGSRPRKLPVLGRLRGKGEWAGACCTSSRKQEPPSLHWRSQSLWGAGRVLIQKGRGCCRAGARGIPGVRERGPRRRFEVRASDFDGGDDDILEFDAEDADLDDDVEVEELSSEEEKLMEAAMLSSGVIETTLLDGDDVASGEGAEGSEHSTPGAPMAHDFQIEESEFHRMPLYSCTFLVRKAPDADDDVYDLSEVYVCKPGSSALSTPTIHGSLPTQARRCSVSEWTYVTGKTMPYSTDPYHASAKEIHEVTKVFLIRHLGDERTSSPHFVLDLEEIYVLDANDSSIRRAHVSVEVETDEARNRREEVLIVRNDGASFKIIPREEQRHVDDVIAEQHWHQSRDSVETYLRGFRDFEKSNWF